MLTSGLRGRKLAFSHLDGVWGFNQGLWRAKHRRIGVYLFYLGAERVVWPNNTSHLVPSHASSPAVLKGELLRGGMFVNRVFKRGSDLAVSQCVVDARSFGSFEVMVKPWPGP